MSDVQVAHAPENDPLNRIANEKPNVNINYNMWFVKSIITLIRKKKQ